jgi:phosphoribosylamine--glycine ligase
MGAVSPLIDLPDGLADDLVARFHEPILAELGARGTPFRGALYAGLMLTPRGPVLLECNARFGDPETQVLMARLAGPIGPTLLAAARGALPAGTRIVSRPGAAVGIVFASAGYPDAPRRGDAISGIEAARAAGALVFHAGTSCDGDGTFRTSGGRVLSVVARGDDIDAARALAEQTAAMITFDGLQRRHDIGSPVTAPMATVGVGA